MLVLTLCWLPYIIIFYPGGLWWDVCTQLWQWKGWFPWTTHHPVFTTIVYGIYIDLGQAIGNANLALFVHNIGLVIMAIWVISYGVTYLYEISKKKWACNILLLFFGILLLWPMNFYCMSKDATYTVGVLMLTISLIQIVEQKGNLKRSQWIFLTVGVILIDLCRKNGIVLLLVIVVFLVFRYWKKTALKKFLICFWGVIIGCGLASRIACGVYDVGEGSVREILSVPLQQTARYMTYYGDDVTSEEREILEKYIDIDVLAGLYDPQMSDDVKFLFKEDADLGDVLDYAKAWFSMGIRHPKCYIKATWDNVCGYINPFVPLYKSDYAQFDINGVDSYIKDFNLYQNATFQEGREILRSFANKVSELPVIRLLFRTGIYIWIWIGLIAIICRKKKREMLLPTIPGCITWLVCLISPVNAYFRYILPMAVSMPILLTWVMLHIFIKDDNKEENHGIE